MSTFSRTWWGQKFIEALESFTDSGRLGRGRSYARGGKILEFAVKKGKIEATIRGSINPYFGVYKEPRYRTEIAIAAIASDDWSKIVQHLSTNASSVAKLLLNEVPENIEASFAAVNQHFLPHSQQEFKTDCSCPDYSNPCKHIAGLCYRFAAELDENPFLLFELRGLSRENLQAELLKTRLGKALAAGLSSEVPAPEPVTSYYTEPQTQPAAATSLKEFWLGQAPLPEIEDETEAQVPGVLIKKQGDYPPFWHQERSFLEVIEELYERVRTKNRSVF